MLEGTIGIEIDKSIYKMRLDMGCLKNMKYIFEKHTVEEIIEGAFDGDKDLVYQFLIQAILRCNDDIDIDMLTKQITSIDLNLAKTYVCYLISISFPKNQQKEESELARFRRLKSSLNRDDWNFSDMEYMWHTILKRTNDFNCILPLSYFSQIESHKKFNNINNGDENTEVVNGTEYF